MTRTRWIVFVVLCVAVLGGLVMLSKKDNVDVSGQDPMKVVDGTSTSIGDQTYGKTDAKVVVTEYADYQCPACGAAHPQIKTIRELYKDTVLFVFRNFPLTTIHPNALAASTAAEAAGLQGKFWEMHDKLYETQDDWSSIDSAKRTDVFAGYAKDLGLNVEQFKTDLSDSRVSDKISRDRALATRLNVDSTPTVYVGDEKADKAVINELVQEKGEQVMKKLDAALKADGVTPPTR